MFITEKVLQQRISSSPLEPGKYEHCSPTKSHDINGASLTNNRPRLQWSPFIFGDTKQSSSPTALHISPLNLEETGVEDNFSKTEVDALLQTLIGSSTSNEDAPAFTPIYSPIGRKYLDDRDRYESVNTLTYSGTTDYNSFKRDVMKSPLCYEKSLQKYKPIDEDKATFRMGLSTPPIKDVSASEKYSAISSLTAPTTKSRKKARLSPSDEIAPKTLSHTMPNLNEAKEIEVFWSAQGEPLLCYRQLCPQLQFNMPDAALGNYSYDSHLQALDTQASHLKIQDESDVNESQIATTEPIPLETYQPGNIQPSPEVNLQGSDMNRIILGIESPSPTKSVSSVGCASPNVFDL